MRNSFLTSKCFVALTVLSACGGNGSTDISLIPQAERATRQFADVAGDGTKINGLSEALQSGETIVARNVSEKSWQENYGDNPGYEAIDAQVSVTIEGNDLLVVFAPQETSNPEPVRIVNAAAIADNSVRIENDDIFFDLYLGGNRSIGSLFTDGFGPTTRLGIYYAGNGDNFGLQTDAIWGVETQDGRLDDLATINGTASFDGYASLNLRKIDESWNTYNSRVEGDLSMIVDFGAGTISGDITNLGAELRAGQTVLSERDLSGRIILEETTFSENAFEGNMSADSALTADSTVVSAVVSNGTYGGAFYGADAESIGGTLQGSGAAEGDAFIAQGQFDAN